MLLALLIVGAVALACRRRRAAAAEPHATELPSTGASSQAVNYGAMPTITSEYGAAPMPSMRVLFDLYHRVFLCINRVLFFILISALQASSSIYSSFPASAASVTTPTSNYSSMPDKVEFNYADPASGFVDASVLEEEVRVHGAVNRKSQKQLYQ